MWRSNRTTVEQGTLVGSEYFLLPLDTMVDVLGRPPAMRSPCLASDRGRVVEEGVQDIMGYLGKWYTEDDR